MGWWGRTSMLLLLVLTLMLASPLTYRYEDISDSCGTPVREVEIPKGIPVIPDLDSSIVEPFVENKGQVENGKVLFYSRGSGISVAFTTDGVYHYLDGPDHVRTVVQQSFVGSQGSTPVGEEEMGHRSNHFRGSDSENWTTGVRSFSRIFYEDVWDNIDMEYYFSKGRLKYDIIVGPHSDPSDVRFRYHGINDISIEDGDLLISTDNGDLREAAPFSYQEKKGHQLEVRSRFVVDEEDTVSFDLGPYKTSLPLVIDPELIYCTLVGGSRREAVSASVCDEDGYVYVAGYTSSRDYPTVAGSYDTSKALLTDSGFVYKLNVSGDRLLYSTYIEGSLDVFIFNMVVDANGSAYLLGTTNSADFPTTNDAYQKTYAGNYSTDIFLTILKPSGSGLEYSTFFGNETRDSAGALAIDDRGMVYIFGSAVEGIPTTSGVYDDVLNYGDASLFKFDPSSNTVLFHTYIGNGTRGDTVGGPVSIIVDDDGCSYLNFQTKSDKFPVTTGAFDTSYNGEYDIGLMKMNENATGLVYSTYFGGSKSDGGGLMALASDGSLYCAGSTWSSDFPTNSTCYDSSYYNNRDIFVFKLTPDGGDYHYDASTDQVACELHGNRRHARQVLGIQPHTSFARFLNSLKEIVAYLKFTDDGMVATVEIARSENASE